MGKGIERKKLFCPPFKTDMITILLIVIYIAYIGLGLPHSLFGAAWPAISSDLSLSVDMANYITVLISGCTVLSSIFGARLAKCFGTGIVVSASAALAAGALLGFSFSSELWMMCIFAIPLGLSAGATDAALNNYIAVNYSAMHMNFLHCFYGVGVMASPYIMSVVLESSGWRTGYHTVFMVQSVIALALIASLPMWKRAQRQNTEEETAIAEAKKVSYLSLARNAKVWLNWVMCISANAIEGVAGLWASTYLVHIHGFGEAEAAGSVMFFYIGIASGRFLSGLLSRKIESVKLIKIGTVVMLLGIAASLVWSPSFAILGLLLIGLGNGPVHPNILHLTPRCFGEEISGTVMGTQMAAAYLGITIAPPIFGFLAKSVSAAVFPWYLASWLVIFFASSFFFFRKVK